MKKITLLIILLISTCFYSQNFWKGGTGPAGGNITSLYTKTGRIVYAGTDDGILNISKDNGITWFSTSVAANSILSLVMDESSNIYAGINGAGIKKSSDNGETWVSLINGLNSFVIQALAIDYSGNIFAGTDNGIYVSTNKGVQWLFSGIDYCNISSIRINSRNKIFVSTYGNGVFCSSDGGHIWEGINNGLADNYIYCLELDESETLYLGSGTGIYKTIDTNYSWSNISGNLPSYAYPQTLNLSFKDKIFAGFEHSGIYITSNQGNSWDALDIGLTNHRINTLKANSDGILFAGTKGSGVFSSNDSGAHWNQLTLVASKILSLNSSGSKVLIAGTRTQGLYISKDKGSSWISTGLNEENIYSTIMTSTGKLFAGSDMGIFVSSDTGKNWALGFNTLTYKSVIALTKTLSEKLFAATSNEIYVSSDMGENWVATYLLPPGEYFFSLAVSPEGTVFATTNNGIVRSTNNGNNWTFLNNGIENLVIGGLAFNTSTIFMATSNGVFSSTNNGNNWIKKSSGLTSVNIFCIARNSSGGIYVYSVAGLFYSGNEGENWTKIGDPFSFPVQAMITDSYGYLYAATEGGGVLRSINPTTYIKTPVSPAQNFELLQNYPNPFNPSTIIRFNVPYLSKIELSIYNILGEKVAELANGVFEAGSHSFEWNASKFSSGVYFCKLETEKHSTVKKIILAK